MIYKDKSKEEIDAALDLHLESFEQRIGFKPSEVELLEWAKKRMTQRVDEARESSFGHLSPKSLEMLIRAIEEKINPPKVEEIQVKEPQKTKKRPKIT